MTINDILERRAKAGKLVAGTAAYSDSDMFKAPVSFSLLFSSPEHIQHLNRVTDNNIVVVVVSRETKGKTMGS